MTRRYRPHVCHHPLVTGTYSYKATNTWVRNLRTGFVGYISYTQRTGPLHPTAPLQTVVWVVSPPRPVNKGLKVYAAGAATPQELKKTRRRQP